MPSCFDPKHDISEPKLVPCGNGQFWVLQTPQNHPRAPQGPPGAPGVQKWPKSSITSPVVMIDPKNPTFKGGQFFSVFFTRNDPGTGLEEPHSRGTTVVWKFSQNSSGLGNLAFPYVFINYCVSSSCFFGENRDPLVVSHSPTAIQCFSSPLLKQRLFHGFLIQQSILHLELTEFFSPNLDFVS